MTDEQITKILAPSSEPAEEPAEDSPEARLNFINAAMAFGMSFEHAQAEYERQLKEIEYKQEHSYGGVG